MKRLTVELSEQLNREQELHDEIRKNLENIGFKCMRTSKTNIKQTEIGKSPESGMAGKWRQARLAEICVHSAFGPRFSGALYASDGNVATLRTTDISEDGRIEYATMPLARSTYRGSNNTSCTKMI